MQRTSPFVFLSFLIVLFTFSSKDADCQYIKKPSEDYNKVKYEQKNYTKYLYYPEVLAMHIEKARVFYFEGDYQSAINKYEIILNTDTTNPFIYHELGLCYFNQSFVSKKVALKYFETSLAKSIPNDTILETFFYLGKTYHMLGENEKAKKWIEYFRSKIKESYEGYILSGDMHREVETITNAIYYVKNKSIPHLVSNIGSTVNKGTAQYNAIIDSEMRRMILVEKNNKFPKSARDNDSEIMRISTFKSSGKWSKPEDLNESNKLEFLNLEKDAEVIGFSGDDNTIYVRQDNLIFMGEIKKGEQINLVPSNLNFAKKDAYEPHFFFTKDSTTCFFSSDRQGGFGGLDIWKATYDGYEWSEAVNLGRIINSAFDEITPYMIKDNSRLYYASKGHSSMGGFDIFYSDHIDEEWSLPKNMRPPINSTMDDFGFMMGPNGKTGLISSAREGGFGDMDIYEFAIECGFISSVRLRGVVMTKDEELKESKITFVNKYTGKMVVTYAAASDRGSFVVELKANTDYIMLFERGGYLTQTQEVHTPKQCEAYELFQVISVNQEKVSETKIEQHIVFRNAFFDIQKHILVKHRDVFDAGLIDASIDYVMYMDPDETSLNLFINEKRIEIETGTLKASDIIRDTLTADETEHIVAAPKVIVKRHIERLNNAEYIVHVAIKQNDLTGSVNLYERIPAGFQAVLVDSSGASYTAEGQDLTFSWDELPKENIVDVSYKIVANENFSEFSSVKGKLEYFANEEKIVSAIEEVRVSDGKVLAFEPILDKSDLENLSLGEEVVERFQSKEDVPTALEKKVSKGKFVFEHVYFAINSSFLTETSEKSLDKVVEHLKGRQKMRLEIGGFCDSTGTKSYNKKLSKRRANSISDYFVVHGIKRRRFKVIGYGERFHKYASLGKNRRVEMFEIPMDDPYFDEKAGKQEDDEVANYDNEPEEDTYEEENQEPGEPVVAADGEIGSLGYYTVQVGAYTHTKDLDYFQDLDEVFEIEGDDGIYRYITGKFDSFSAALDLLSTVQGAGYSDSFVQQ
ncbi:MAG: OmpA family protein [Flavobacteriales bacterium]|nr:OmpA family protein [Flavobacteriales bacterium]